MNSILFWKWDLCKHGAVTCGHLLLFLDISIFLAKYGLPLVVEVNQINFLYDSSKAQRLNINDVINYSSFFYSILGFISALN